jgi:hypothetical protein
MVLMAAVVVMLVRCSGHRVRLLHGPGQFLHAAIAAAQL